MKTVFISAGHSNVDPGAIANGRREADIAVETRNMVSFYLTQMGVPHVLDGKQTENLPLKTAVAIARKNQIAVEFHCNASVNIQATGVEVLCADKDKTLAGNIVSAIARTLRLRSRGVKPENSGQHSRLAFVQAGGLIVEMLFITNLNDLKMYDERKWLMAREIAMALRDAAR